MRRLRAAPGARRTTLPWRYPPSPVGHAVVAVLATVAVATLLSACGGPGAAVRASTTSTPTTSTPTTSTPTTSTPTTSTPTTSTVPPARRATPLEEGSIGARVAALQRRLTALHFWLGRPDGVFGDATQQAVYAFQKVAGIPADGIVGSRTAAALSHGAEPTARPVAGRAVEVDLADDVLLIVVHGTVVWVLNTSTGGGYTYEVDGVSAVAQTPLGVFHVYRQVDGLVVDALGALWRPKYFVSGFAIHGDSDVPPYPVSHGCVRVSDEAIDWLWSSGQLPLGTEVWVYA